MPQLGESVTEGTIGKWLKQKGDPVALYEPLVEVITDKVNAEIPSEVEGVFGDIVVPEGETVAVGTVICRIETSGDQTSTPAVALPSGTRPVAAGPADAGRSATPRHVVLEPGETGRYSPAVLKLAQEHGINLTAVQGSGEGGRITRKDVLGYIDNRSQAKSAAGASPGATPPIPSAPHDTVATAEADDEWIEPSPIRRTIARRMVESKQTAPHAWMMVEADVTKLVALREAAKADFRRKEGVDLTFVPFFIKAVVEALKQYPLLNAAWENDRIHQHKRINITVPVATDDALAVPVIHDADRLSIAGIAHAVHDLATRARSGRLTRNDVQGGTFTVNNTGAFGSILSQPIINTPQSGILTMETIVKRPVVVGDAIAIRSMVNLCLSLDHRLLDGWVSGQFMKAVKDRLQAFDSDTPLF